MGILPETKTVRDLSEFEKQLNHGYRRDMVALFILLALAGSVALTFTHRYGPWVDAGIVEQIAAARNFAWGNGLIVPTADGVGLPYGLHPPLYLLFLSLLFWLGLDIYWVVSAINVVVFGGALFLLSWGLWRSTDSLLMALGITIMFAVSPELMQSFDSAASGGVLILFMVANLVCLVLYFQNENRRPFLLALVMAALAFLTDFIGGACIIAGAIVILIFSEKSVKRRLQFAGIYILGAAAPLILWQIVHLPRLPRAGTRVMAITMTFGDAARMYLSNLVTTLLQWLPGEPRWLSAWLQTRAAFSIIVMLSLALFGVVVWRSVHHKDTAHRRWMILLTSCLAFAAGAVVLLFAESFLQDRTVPVLTPTRLAPLYPFLMIFLFGSMLALIASYNLPMEVLAVPVLIGGLYILANLRPGFSYVQSRYAHGSGYMTPQWRSSQLLERVNTTSALRTYFSNDPSGVLFYTNYAPYDIRDFDYGKPFLEQDDYFTANFLDWNGTLLLFQPAYFDAEEVEQEPIDFSVFTEGLQLVYRGADGEMYTPIYPEEGEE
ncbi:MAG: hypothetical protein V2J07_06895 [Anaerolineae bacterium]|nr:hypothetical protein [Anaerolineae bacterium]